MYYACNMSEKTLISARIDSHLLERVKTFASTTGHTRGVSGVIEDALGSYLADTSTDAASAFARSYASSLATDLEGFIRNLNERKE